MGKVTINNQEFEVRVVVTIGDIESPVPEDHIKQLETQHKELHRLLTNIEKIIGRTTGAVNGYMQAAYEDLTSTNRAIGSIIHNLKQ